MEQINLQQLSDSQISEMLDQIESASQPGFLGFPDGSLMQQYIMQLNPDVRLIQSTVDVYREAARRWRSIQK